jgi:hypothetical protein
MLKKIVNQIKRYKDYSIYAKQLACEQIRCDKDYIPRNVNKKNIHDVLWSWDRNLTYKDNNKIINLMLHNVSEMGYVCVVRKDDIVFIRK